MTDRKFGRKPNPRQNLDNCPLPLPLSSLLHHPLTFHLSCLSKRPQNRFRPSTTLIMWSFRMLPATEGVRFCAKRSVDGVAIHMDNADYQKELQRRTFDFEQPSNAEDERVLDYYDIKATPKRRWVNEWSVEPTRDEVQLAWNICMFSSPCYAFYTQYP